MCYKSTTISLQTTLTKTFYQTNFREREGGQTGQSRCMLLKKLVLIHHLVLFAAPGDGLQNDQYQKTNYA